MPCNGLGLEIVRDFALFRYPPLIKVEDSKIKDIGFKTFGCPAAVASSDVVCELAKGKTLEQAKKIKKEDIIKKLKGMPPIKVHCSVLGIQALKKAIENYKNRKYLINKKIKRKIN